MDLEGLLPKSTAAWILDSMKTNPSMLRSLIEPLLAGVLPGNAPNFSNPNIRRRTDRTAAVASGLGTSSALTNPWSQARNNQEIASLRSSMAHIMPDATDTALGHVRELMSLADQFAGTSFIAGLSNISDPREVMHNLAESTRGRHFSHRDSITRATALTEAFNDRVFSRDS